jgi:hypothetical protein
LDQEADYENENDVTELNPLVTERNTQACDATIDRSSRQTLIHCGDGDGDGGEDEDQNELGSGVDDNALSSIVTYSLDTGVVPSAQFVSLSGSIDEEGCDGILGEEERGGAKGVGEGTEIGFGEAEDFGEFIGESSSFASTVRSASKRKLKDENKVTTDIVIQPAFLYSVEEELIGEPEERVSLLPDPSSPSPLLEVRSPCTVKKKSGVKRQLGRAVGVRVDDSKKAKKARKVKEKDCIDDIFANL